MRKWITLLVVCLGLALVVPGAIANASTVDKDTQKLIDNAGGKDKYPDANALILDSETSFDFNDNGTGVGHTYELIKVLTEKGIDSYGEVKYPFYKVYDSVTVDLARVIKKDGTVIDVPPDMMKDISAIANQAMNIYDENALERVITFKGLEIGDAIEYRVTDYVYQAPMDNEFDAMEVFQGFDPIIEKKFVLSGPKDKPLRYVVRNGDVKFKKEEKGDRVTYVWSAKDVDRIIREPAMPSLTEVAPTVIATTIKSWEEISRWWYAMVEPKLKLNDAMRAEVDTLIQGKKTKQEKIDAIYHFVAQKVRYMGLGTGTKKGFEPKPVTETFSTRYGVCRDVAAMMVSMLRDAGVESDVVLTMAGADVDPDLPHLHFNHAIVAIKNADGSFTYADPTVENSRVWLPAVESKQDVLVCTPKGRTLTETPLMPADENMGHIKANSNLTEDGLYTSDVTITTDGIYDLALRQWAKQMPSAQMSMIWGYLLQRVYPGIQLTNFETTDANDLNKPFEIKFSYKIENYPTEAGEFTLMKSPVSTGTFEIMSQYLLASASLPERKYPWALGFTFGASEEETINLPPGLKVKSMPDPFSSDKGPIDYKMTYTASKPTELASGGTQVTYHKEFLLNSTKLSPKEYAEYKDIMRTASRSARGELIMQSEAKSE